MIFSENRLPLFRIMRKRVADDAGEPLVEIVTSAADLKFLQPSRKLAEELQIQSRTGDDFDEWLARIICYAFALDSEKWRPVFPKRSCAAKN